MTDLSKDKREIVAELRDLLPKEGYTGDYAAGCASIRAEPELQVAEFGRLQNMAHDVYAQRVGSFIESCQVGLTHGGVAVSSVQKDGPAFSSGVTEDQELVAINGVSVSTPEDLAMIF